MVYEMRYYEVVPGRMPALNARFRDHTCKLFGKHGIKIVGFWEAYIGTSNVLNYMLAFDDLAHRERAWNAFQSDPEWQKARASSEESGPIVARVRSEIWKPTDYSPLQ